MAAFDHVIITVGDIDAAAEEIYATHGLASIRGGRHPGHGTGNRVIPLGDGYLELMGIVDRAEAESSPLGRWVLGFSNAAHRRALCLRTEDIASVAASGPGDPLAMSRVTPDGNELSWHLAGLDRMLADGDPFYIQWHIDPSHHPGRAEAAHRVDPAGIAWVELPMELDEDLDVRLRPELPGVGRVGVATSAGEIVI